MSGERRENRSGDSKSAVGVGGEGEEDRNLHRHVNMSRNDAGVSMPVANSVGGPWVNKS